MILKRVFKIEKVKFYTKIQSESYTQEHYLLVALHLARGHTS